MYRRHSTYAGASSVRHETGEAQNATNLRTKGEDMQMTQITFNVNNQTLEMFNELKTAFNVETRADVLRRLLALARVATVNANPDNTLTIVDQEGEQQKILLQG